MPKTSSTTGELQAMQMPDLDREIRAQVLLVEKLRLGIALKKEKDTAQLRRGRRALARMQTERTRKAAAQLQGSAKPSTVPASAQPSPQLRPASKATADKPASRP